MNLLQSISSFFSNLFAPGWTVYSNVQYGWKKEQTADLYLLNKGVHPVMIWIHGGGWSSGDKAAYEGRARMYARAGIHSIAINYTMAQFGKPDTQWPEQLKDVIAAIRWIRQNASALRINPAAIGVGGDSAGAHLALMLGTTTERPKAILDMFGPTDLSMPGFTEFVAALPIFDGKTCAQVPELYASASPINLISTDFPPTIIMHGVNDATVPYIQSFELDRKLRESGVDHELVTFGGGHVFANMSKTAQLDLELQGLRWMIKRLNAGGFWA